MSSNFGLKMKTARKQAGLTQRDLAVKIEKGFSTVQKYENGVVEPPVSVMIDIAQALGITPIELMETVVPFPGDMTPIIDKNERRARLNAAYNILNEKGQEKAADYVEDLAKVKEYQKP